MPVCPECDSMLDFEVEEVDEGDVVSCDECGSELEVVGTEPLELAKIDDDDEDEDTDDEEEE
jgi:alpha-aminoadipate carrier protein LysW